MSSKRPWFRTILFTLVIVALAFPVMAGAQESGLISPAEGATLSGTVDVTAVFPGSPYVRWDLFILPGGSDSGKIWVASGKDAGEATLSLDTTKYPDGDHAFSLRLVKVDSNYDEQIVNFTIDNSGAAAEAAPAADAADIVDTAIAAGSFKTLVAAVQAAGLVDTLKGDGPFTVFAPTDEAFAKLPAGTVEGLLADPEALANILLYHVVPGKVMAADVTDGLVAKTAQGSTVTFTVADGAVKINDANISATDIETSNGVIHVIDSVILPPADAPAAAAPAPAPTTGLISPTDGATLSGTVDVTAVFPGSPYVRWDLFILPGGNDSGKIWVASGTDAGEATLSLDTTKYPNGEHAFSLRLVKSDGNYDEQIVPFTIAN